MNVIWDPFKARSNLTKHGIAFEDAEIALADPAALTSEDPDARGEHRFVTVVTDAFGRVVAVVYAYGDTDVGLSQPDAPPARRKTPMRQEYDLSDAKRGPVLKQSGKTRITILLDRDVVNAFRARAEGTGRGYQTAINQALREYLANDDLEATLRRVVREELRNAV